MSETKIFDKKTVRGLGTILLLWQHENLKYVRPFSGMCSHPKFQVISFNI